MCLICPRGLPSPGEADDRDTRTPPSGLLCSRQLGEGALQAAVVNLRGWLSQKSQLVVLVSSRGGAFQVGGTNNSSQELKLKTDTVGFP